MPNGKMNCFIDTNVLLYAQDQTSPEKRKRAVEWLDAVVDREIAIISPQVMNEFAYACIKKLRHISIDQLLGTLQEMAMFCRASTVAESAINGLLLHQRYKLPFYDAVLIASAISADCRIFLSEDLNHSQSFGELRIINPFLTAPQDIL